MEMSMLCLIQECNFKEVLVKEIQNKLPRDKEGLEMLITITWHRNITGNSRDLHSVNLKRMNMQNTMK